MQDRFTEFCAGLAKDTYPEAPSTIHSEITAQVLPGVVAMCPPGARVLDVGCGQGVALRHFVGLGCFVRGVTTNTEDRKACEALRLRTHSLNGNGMEDVIVFDEDMHSMNWIEEAFDLIWARHVLEHSPAPLFALHEFKRVLKPGGLLYVEVPMPGTACQHEFNRNHYSVLTCAMWQALIAKAGFTLLEGKVHPLQTQAGPDEYRSYLCRK